eukprot:CAMPEP_0195071160 /NCGR_PEP_ID=MMETSP0448-20130528/15045_1 /TAXON_ID=66468 /ORGANISM="Heterocapsa triquestra, Strain CCMP 448" /LENGTH=58 /DNA_ID=CAMNT_0040102965 /DNA_START=15 /DNA_END=188 /DNA_ORIENTATION=+
MPLTSSWVTPGEARLKGKHPKALAVMVDAGGVPGEASPSAMTSELLSNGARITAGGAI